MSNILKEIQKSKSFDKRLSIISQKADMIDSSDFSEICSLVSEAIKNDGHTRMMICEIGKFNFPEKELEIKKLSLKIERDPQDAGSALIVMFCNGMNETAEQYFEYMLENKFTHPNI